MLKKDDSETLALARLEDSKILMREKKASSAYYLSGYAVELALKACIAKQIQSNVIPDKSFIDKIYKHDLDALLGLAGLRSQFQADTRMNPKLEANWGIVTKWNEQSRYEIWDPVAAVSLLDAIDDPDNGVFQWVKKHW